MPQQVIFVSDMWLSFPVYPLLSLFVRHLTAMSHPFISFAHFLLLLNGCDVTFNWVFSLPSQPRAGVTSIECLLHSTEPSVKSETLVPDPQGPPL